MNMLGSFKKIIIVDTSNLAHHCAHGTFFWYTQNFDMSGLNPIGEVDWSRNPEFVSFFKNKFKRELKQVCHRLAGDMSQVIFAVDCPVAQIWRMDHYSAYKANRRTEKDPTKPNFRSIFYMLYNEFLPELIEQNGCSIVGHPRAEADDIIAAIAKNISDIDKSVPIYIITTDKDLHQCIDENVKVINQITEQMYDLSNVNPAKHMFLKVILGDAGDDVPKLKDKVGPKRAEKWYNDMDAFFEELKKDPELEKKFQLNYILMSLDQIPEDIMESTRLNVVEILEGQNKHDLQLGVL